jgi:hypothetical protein
VRNVNLLFYKRLFSLVFTVDIKIQQIKSLDFIQQICEVVKILSSKQNLEMILQL